MTVKPSQRSVADAAESYRFFVRQSDGSYGAQRLAPYGNAAEALGYAQMLADEFGGCDLWRGGRRLAFIATSGGKRQRKD